MNTIFMILDNTFFGTLLAGSILAYLGLFLYRRQKQIDIKYEDNRKVRELASLLFTNIEIAAKEFKSQLNIHDGKNPLLKTLSDAINSNFSNYSKEESQKRFLQHYQSIDQALNNLLAHLKMYRYASYTTQINLLTEKTSTVEMYLVTSFGIGDIGNEQLVELIKREFNGIVSEIVSTLQAIINAKV